jgi:HEAT repeat protein
MWRRTSDSVYALLVLVVFCGEALALGLLTWVFLFRLSHVLPGLITSGAVEVILIGGIAVTALMLLTLTSFVLVHHFLDRYRERIRNERMDLWAQRWAEVLLDDSPPPPAPLSLVAVEALLNLRAVLSGDEGKRIGELIHGYGLGPVLLKGLSSRRAVVRLESLERLAKARLAGSLRALFTVARRNDPAMRVMAVRAAGHTIGAMPPGPLRDRFCDQFTVIVRDASLPSGVVQEALLLLEGASRDMLVRLLDDPEISSGVLRTTLEAAGRLREAGLANWVGVFASHDDPEVRAAALRALGRLGELPAAARAAVIRGLSDDVEFVRVQAAHATALLPVSEAMPYLWDLLADPAWWVRKAAATTMLRMEDAGVWWLRRAATGHPDRYAEQMATQELNDFGVGVEDAAQAVLRETKETIDAAGDAVVEDSQRPDTPVAVEGNDR